MIDHNHFDDQIVSNLLMKSTSWQNCWVTDKMVEWRMRWLSDAWDGWVTHKMVEWRIKWRIKWRIDFDIPLIYKRPEKSCCILTWIYIKLDFQRMCFTASVLSELKGCSQGFQAHSSKSHWSDPIASDCQTRQVAKLYACWLIDQKELVDFFSG